MSLSFVNNTFRFHRGEDDSSSDESTDSPVPFILFFVKTSANMSALMETAYEAFREKLMGIDDLCLRVIDAAECLNIPKAELKTIAPKKIFAFDDFDDKNEAFNYISSADTVSIFGSRALIAMILEGARTRTGLYHVHNFTMQNYVVCTSNISNEKKRMIKKHVNYMNGKHRDILQNEVTHLVCGGVNSEKYEAAAKCGFMKIMHSDWVKHVWEASAKSENVRIECDKFDSFKLPIFFNLIFTSTGLDTKRRNEIQALIEENGGKYSPSYNNSILILLMQQKDIGSTKHKAAVASNKTCLHPDWIYESIKLGYSTSLESFKIKTESLKSSTPTKKTANSTVSNFNPDCTKLSEISHNHHAIDVDISIAETVASTSMRSTRSSLRVSNQQQNGKEINKVSNFGFSLKDARKVGPVLDGCNVYLDGFAKDAQTELNKVLIALGALKFNDIDDNTTHIIVGDISNDLFEMIRISRAHPIVVKVEWLKQVIIKKALVNEKEFEIKSSVPVQSKKSIEKPSPSSKKVMNSLTHSFKKPARPNFDLEELDPASDIIGQYLEISRPVDELEDTVEDSASTTTNPILNGKDVFVYGFTIAVSKEIIEMCENLGANLVDSSFKREVDYVVTPNCVKNFNFPVSYKNLVSEAWIHECNERGSLVDTEIWSRPYIETRRPILDGEILVVSNYKGNSRSYISLLISELGGIPKTSIDTTCQNMILITDTDLGIKFEFIKKKNFAALPAEWLLECNKNQTRVDERPYLIGGTMPSKNNLKPVSNRESIVPSSQADESFDFYDPPIENIEEPMMTARNPSAPSSCVKRLLNEMPTPIRKEAATALNIGRKQSNSPRRRALHNRIDCGVEKTPVNERSGLRLRPDESPNTTEHHKRRLEGLDKLYEEPCGKRKKIDPPVELPEPSPPYRYKRYEFYQNRLDEYKSPDPRNGIPSPPNHETTVGTKLNFEGLQDQTQDSPDFFAVPADNADINKQPKKPKFQIMTEEYNTDPYSIDFRNPGTENLVTWDSGTQCVSKPAISQRRRIFTFSFLAENVRENLIGIVESLNGEVTNGSEFTHLMTPQPSKGEKYLSGIAKGAYLLHPKYLYKCKEEGRFVDEDEYEFGNPAAAGSSYTQKFDEQVAEAGYRWRKWIQETHREQFPNGAFTSINFIMLNLQADRIEQLSNVMIAGGGTMLNVDMTQTSSDELKRQELKYCFTDLKKTIKADIKKKLENADVKILSLNSIFHYLISKEVPNDIQ